MQPLQYFAKVHSKGDEAWDVQEPLSQLVNCDCFPTRPTILSHEKKNKSPGTQKWKILCFVSFSIVNFDLFQRKDMGSEESVGSVELKKILESFEAGEVLPEVRNIFSFDSRLLWT